MFDYLQGKLVEKTSHNVVIDIQGIGYKLLVPTRLFAQLPAVGETLLLFVSWVVREMSQTLYGFASKEERELFELLLALSGIGPKTALALIGHFELPALEEAVYTENSRAIAQVPGIGKKTAERLILELKDKLKITLLSKGSFSSSKVQDALNALLSLGCPRLEAEHAVKMALSELSDQCDLPALITAALRYQGNPSLTKKKS